MMRNTMPPRDPDEDEEDEDEEEDDRADEPPVVRERTKTRALGVSLIGAAGADRMLLALANKSASLQLRLGLAAPAFLGKRLFGTGADPARIAADRLQGCA